MCDALMVGYVGIISACAERTSRTPASRCRSRDHLRVCGADPLNAFLIALTAGSSPRVRSGLPRALHG